MNTCAILSIGNELLLGHTLDTNAAFLCQQMTTLGWRVCGMATVGDDLPKIIDAITRAAASADVVLMTGGLGPTPDDLTRDGIAGALGVGLSEHADLVEAIQARFTRMKRVMTDSNLRQALLPDGATALKNECGTAPGVRAVLNGTRLFSMPGVPSEMKEMFALRILPEIENVAGNTAMRRMHYCGASESSFSEPIRAAEKEFGAEIGTTVDDMIITVRVRASDPDKQKADAICLAASEQIRQQFLDSWFSDDDATMASTVIDLLKKNGKTLALAESCTGGLIASALIDVPGASDVLIESAVTYSNAAKIRRLGVREETLDKYGAVSKQTAAEMARGVLQTTGADYSLAATGIAGPGGGTEEKPVGTVWLALGTPSGVYCNLRHFLADRRGNRVRAVNTALDLLRRHLSGQPFTGDVEHIG